MLTASSRGVNAHYHHSRMVLVDDGFSLNVALSHTIRANFVNLYRFCRLPVLKSEGWLPIVLSNVLPERFRRMGLESERNDAIGDAAGEQDSNLHQENFDGALSTLCSVIRITGDECFPMGGERDDALFPRLCADFARHVENGAAVPDYDIERGDGRREWSVVQRFFVNRRRNEKQFVTERLSGYRDIVNDLVSGLREIDRRDDDTAANVRECLTSLQDAIGVGEIAQLQAALTDTIGKVNEIFAEQKHCYEMQLNELNERMSNLRHDLVTAREEMKRDALTQAFNRGAFDSSIAQSLNMHYISRQPVTLLMIDLDDFKQVNDQHGHGAGDAVLRAVGDCLARSFIRKNDLVARYGGDEFAVILADTAGVHVVSLVERFLSRVRAIEIQLSDMIVNISCSVGFTEAFEGDTIETFVNRADAALYQAKAQGRDQSVHILTAPNDFSDRANLPVADSGEGG